MMFRTVTKEREMVGKNPERVNAYYRARLRKWLGIAQRTVCTWAECDELPAIKVGRQWRFSRADIHGLAAGGRAK